MDIKIELVGRGVAVFTAAAEDLASPKAKSAARMALNDTGRQTVTQVKRALVKQTGITYGAIKKGVRQEFATNANLQFKIIGTGKHFGLADFGARQTARGVSAAPWNSRKIFRHTFIVRRLGGQVFVRTSKDRFPIKKLYGPAIPRELVRDQVPIVFGRMAASILPVQIRKQFARLMPK